MNMSEIDFWWLVCYKRANFPNTKIIAYEPGIPQNSDRDIMCNTYDINLVDRDIVLMDGEYKQYYADVIERIRKRLL